MEAKITYEWSWVCLSLFRNDGSGSSRVFTLKPAWVWRYWQNEFMVAIGKWPPDPFYVFEKWLRKNNLWNTEGEAFYRAIDRYSNSCPPGRYLSLNSGFIQ